MKIRDILPLLKITDEAARLRAARRITVLWAFHEAVMGGLLHLLNIPFSKQLIVMGAIVLSSLLVWLHRMRWQPMMLSLGVVLAVKYSISPHTPVPAAISVTYQAVLALLIFRTVPRLAPAAYLYAFSVAVMSFIQQIAVPTLLLGKDLWTTMDAVATRFAQTLHIVPAEVRVHAAGIFIGIFILTHTAVSLISGRIVSRMPQRLAGFFELSGELEKHHCALKQSGVRTLTAGRRKRRLLPVYIWLLTLSVLVAAGLTLPDGSRDAAIRLLVRSIILLILVVLARPLIRFLQARLIQKGKAVFAAEVQSVTQALPEFENLVRYAWTYTREQCRSIGFFCMLVIALTLTCPFKTAEGILK